MMLVAIAVLSLILALQGPPFSVIQEARWILPLAAVAALLPALLAAWTTKQAIDKLERSPADISIAQNRYGRGMFHVQLLIAALQAGLILGTDWLRICGDLTYIGTLPMLPGLLAAIPLLLSFLLVWIAVYPIDRAIRSQAIEEFVRRGRPVQPVWTLDEFVTFNYRHQILIVLLPMMLILGARDVIERFDTQLRDTLGHPFVPDLILGSAALGVALISPLILRFAWVTDPLPGGPLRDQLQVLARQLNVKCRELLVWRSGGMVINAAVMGVLAPLRYVMITDAMIQQMEDREIEAVFGHEAGHVKRHHIQFFLLFSLITGCLLTLSGQWTRGMDQQTYQVALVLLGGMLIFKWGVLFGWISRSFERQADLYGVYALEQTGLECKVPCAVHGGIDNKTEHPAMCAQAAHLFGQTLHNVAYLNNIPAEAWTWRHGSISERSRILQVYARDPAAMADFIRTIRITKWCIAITATAATGWVIYELQLWRIAAKLFGG